MLLTTNTLNLIVHIVISVLKSIKSVPLLRKFMHFLIFILNKNQKIIIGTSNDIHINTQGNLPVIKNVIFKIYGNRNSITVKQGVKLLNTKIEIHGDGQELVIEDYCNIQGSYIWMEDNDGLLKIGRGTTFEKEVRICVSEGSSKINIGESCMLAYGIWNCDQKWRFPLNY